MHAYKHALLPCLPLSSSSLASYIKNSSMETMEVFILYKNVLYRQGEQREQGGRNMCPVMCAVMNMLA